MAAKSRTKQLTTVKSTSLTTINAHEKKQESKSEKSVSFHPKVKVRFPKNPKEYTEKDVKKRWYTDKDFQHVKNDTRKTLLYMKQQLENGNKGTWSTAFCSRGLEWKTLEGLKLLLHRRKKVTKALFEEQKRQRDSGMDEIDPLLISKACTKYTKRSIQDAHLKGLQDQKAMEATLSTGSPCKPSLSNTEKYIDAALAKQSDVRSNMDGSVREVRAFCPQAA